jgi:hypothetical protein
MLKISTSPSAGPLNGAVTLAAFVIGLCSSELCADISHFMFAISA